MTPRTLYEPRVPTCQTSPASDSESTSDCPNACQWPAERTFKPVQLETPRQALHTAIETLERDNADLIRGYRHPIQQPNSARETARVSPTETPRWQTLVTPLLFAAVAGQRQTIAEAPFS